MGDRFPIEFPDGAVEDLEVVAVYGADLFQSDVVISLDAFASHYDWDLDQMVIVLLEDGVDPEAVRPALEAVVADYPNAELNNAEEYVDKVAAQLDLMLNMLTGMLAMAIVIALLGIANTLALSIMERKREIGLLRAVGMTRRQVRRMIRWEAVLIAVFGAVIGMLVGVGLGVAVVIAIGVGPPGGACPGRNLVDLPGAGRPGRGGRLGDPRLAGLAPRRARRHRLRVARRPGGRQPPACGVECSQSSKQGAQGGHEGQGLVEHQVVVGLRDGDHRGPARPSTRTCRRRCRR